MLWNRLRDQVALATGNFARLFGQMVIPTLPQVAVRLLELARADEVDIAEMADVISSDAGLSSKIMRTVNSAQMSLTNPVSDIHHAVTLLGIKRIQSVALAYSAVGALSKPVEGFAAQTFWQASLQRAAFARVLATNISPGNEGEAFTGALLQDMALPILLTRYRDSYEPVWSQASEAEGKLVELEIEKLSWSHAQAGAWMARNWGFPDVLICCIGLHHATPAELAELNLTQTPILAVAISSQLPDVGGTLHDELGLDDEQCHQLYQAVDQACGQLAELLGVQAPGALLQGEYS